MNVLIKKIIAAVTAAVMAALFSLNIVKPDSMQSPVSPVETSNASAAVSEDISPMAQSIEYAHESANAVSATYVDSARSGYLMKNKNMQLLHRLTDAQNYATLAAPGGNDYIKDSFKTFYTDILGVKHYFENSFSDARVNTIRLGQYYYECHVRDLSSGIFKVDKGFHVYSDRLYAEYSLMSKKETKAFRAFGSEITIPAYSVIKLEIKDKNGVHTSAADIDPSSVEYAAFDIKGAGTVCFIISENSGTKAASLVLSRGQYVLTQTADCNYGTGLNKYDETGKYESNKITFGFRIFTDNSHEFDSARKAAEHERNPLKGITVGKNSSGASYLGYDPLRGTYTFEINGTDFNTAYQNPQLRFAAPVEITSDGAQRDIYIRFTSPSSGGQLEAAALLDENNNLLPIDAQVCKNFRGDGGESFYSVIDYAYGDTFVPLRVPAGEKIKFTMLNLYQNWGKYPLKQLSSIEFHISYYHLSTGVTESNCIAPYSVGYDGWLLPDFRCRSGKMWLEQPQFNSTGCLHFAQFRDKNYKYDMIGEFTGTKIDSVGLTYSDITNYYTSSSGKFSYSLRHVEFPQTDENRTYYSVNIKFIEDMEFENFKRDFDIFAYDSRSIMDTQVGYLNEQNVPAADTLEKETDYVTRTLGKNCPYYSVFDAAEESYSEIENHFGCNFALIIKDSSVKINSRPADVNFGVRYRNDGDKTCTALTLDCEKVTFKKGDEININMILLPWGTGYEKNDDAVLNVRLDSAVKPLSAAASQGEVISDAFLPCVKAENGEARFKISGGKNNCAVKICGLDRLARPVVEKLSGGQREKIELSSSYGYDGYSVRLEDDGTFSYSFIIERPSPEDEAEYAFSLEK